MEQSASLDDHEEMDGAEVCVDSSRSVFSDAHCKQWNALASR